MRRDLLILSAALVLILIIALLAYKAQVYSDEQMITGMTDSGREVKAMKTCFEGRYFIKNYGAVLGEYGGPAPCVYDREEQ